MKNLLSALALSTALVAGAAFADEVKPAVVFDMGGKFDRSFNEGIYNGSKKWSEESGVKIAEFEVTNESQREQALRRMAENGANVVIAVGFAQAPALEIVADEFPDVKFAIIDAVVEKPNVQSIVFKEQEGSFLVGVLAALASKTGTIGFVGAADVPLMQKFANGYAAGARATRPGVTTLVDYVGTDTAAFRDRDGAAQVARDEIGRGADVVFAVAGEANLGVFQAAREGEKLAIGVDSNQNGVVPGTILTSMLKRVDIAVLRSLDDMRAGTWSAGLVTLGVREHAVGWAIDDNNRPLVTPEMEEAVETARRAIADGTIKVPDPTAP